jgi:hypothetical protein
MANSEIIGAPQESDSEFLERALDEVAISRRKRGLIDLEQSHHE